MGVLRGLDVLLLGGVTLHRQNLEDAICNIESERRRRMGHNVFIGLIDNSEKKAKFIPKCVCVFEQCT